MRDRGAKALRKRERFDTGTDRNRQHSQHRAGSLPHFAHKESRKQAGSLWSKIGGECFVGGDRQNDPQERRSGLAETCGRGAFWDSTHGAMQDTDGLWGTEKRMPDSLQTRCFFVLSSLSDLSPLYSGLLTNDSVDVDGSRARAWGDGVLVSC